MHLWLNAPSLRFTQTIIQLLQQYYPNLITCIHIQQGFKGKYTTTYIHTWVKFSLTWWDYMLQQVSIHSVLHRDTVYGEILDCCQRSIWSITPYCCKQSAAAWIIIIICVLRKWCYYQQDCVSVPQWLRQSWHMTVILGLVTGLSRTEVTSQPRLWVCVCVCAHTYWSRIGESCGWLSEEWHWLYDGSGSTYLMCFKGSQLSSFIRAPWLARLLYDEPWHEEFCEM